MTNQVPTFDEKQCTLLRHLGVRAVGTGGYHPSIFLLFNQPRPLEDTTMLSFEYSPGCVCGGQPGWLVYLSPTRASFTEEAHTPLMPREHRSTLPRM